MNIYYYFLILAFLSGIIVWLMSWKKVSKVSFENSQEATEVSLIIKKASFIFFKNQVFFLLVVGLLASLSLKYFQPSFDNKLFFMGIIFSAIVNLWCVYLGSSLNLKTALAAEESKGKALQTGLLSGIIVYLPVTMLFFLFKEIFNNYIFFILGVAFASLYQRLSGGLYTKCADITADFSGKVIAGLREDSPENPASIADSTGDLVADLTNTLLSVNCLLGFILYIEKISKMNLVVLFISGLFSMVIPLFFMNYSREDIKETLKRYFITSNLISLCFYIFISRISNIFLFTNQQLFYLVSIFLINIFSYLSIDYFTDGKRGNNQGNFGSSQIVLFGLSESFKYLFIFIFNLILLFKISKHLSIYMLLSSFLTFSILDFLGGITDNAGAILEFTGKLQARDRADDIDKSGNTTKAFTKNQLTLLPLVSFLTKNSINLEITDFVYIFVGFVITFFYIYVSINTLIKVSVKSLEQTKEIIESKQTENNDLIKFITNKSVSFGILTTLISIFLFSNKLNLHIKNGIILSSGIFSVIFCLSGALWDNMKKYRKNYEKNNKLEKSQYTDFVAADLIGDFFKDLVGVVSISLLTLVVTLIYI